jgi:hypothetical protein
MKIRPEQEPGQWDNRDGWKPKQAWPEDCFAQWGKESECEGIVINAFFGVFPTNPKTFIACEAATRDEAEARAFEYFQKYSACSGHEFEARGYENGAGFCKHCGMFASDVIPPVDTCRSCGVPTWGSKDNEGFRWCKACSVDMPVELRSESRLKIDQMKADHIAWENGLKAKGKDPGEEITKALPGVIEALAKAVPDAA